MALIAAVERQIKKLFNKLIQLSGRNCMLPFY